MCVCVCVCVGEGARVCMRFTTCVLGFPETSFTANRFVITIFCPVKYILFHLKWHCAFGLQLNLKLHSKYSKYVLRFIISLQTPLRHYFKYSHKSNERDYVHSRKLQNV